MPCRGPFGAQQGLLSQKRPRKALLCQKGQEKPSWAFFAQKRPILGPLWALKGLIWALKGLNALPGAFLCPTRPFEPKKAKKGLTLPKRPRKAFLGLFGPEKANSWAFVGLKRPNLGLKRP